MKKLALMFALLIAAPAYAQQVIELAPGDSIRVQRVSPLLIRAAPVDTVLAADTIFVTDTVTVTDTLVITRTDTVYVPVEAPAAPNMYVAGWADTIPGATENGLWIAWDGMPADSFRVTGGKQDGTDPFAAIVPGSDTTHIHLLFYDTVTAMRGCVSAFRFGFEGPEACDDFEWAPMVQGGPEPPGTPGRPTFSVTADGIRVTWTEAVHATNYTYWYTGHAESEGLTTPTNNVTLPDFLGGGFFCVRAMNSGVPGQSYRCNSFSP